MRNYQRGWLRGDVLAGVTVTAYLIPQVMAYAEVAGLPAVVGLWASVAALMVYAVFGSSPQLSVGPESTTALMTATALGGIAAGQPERYAALAAALAGLVGLFCLVAWAARLGFLAELLSRPVLVGYMSGVAVLMVISQLGKFTGLSVEGDTPLAEIVFVLEHLRNADATTLLLAVAVLTFLLVGSRLFPRAPIPLIGMLLAAGVVVLFDLQDRGITVVGAIPRELPSLQLPDFEPDDLRELVPAALGIAMVAFTDNILTARAFQARHASGLDSNQELLAIGAANLAVGAAQGFPVSSSGSRTAIGDSMGSRSQLYSIAALAMVVLAVVFLGPILAAFPTAALGAVVVYAAVRLVDVPEFRRIGGFRRTELALALGTTVAVLALGALQACSSRWHSRYLTCCTGSPDPTTAFWDMSPASRACMTSTTTRMPSPCPVSSSTGTTRRSSSPMRRTSPDAPWPPSTLRRHPPGGSCSMPRPTSPSISPQLTRSRRCGSRSRDEASSSRWPGSSRTCATTSSALDSLTAWASRASS